MGKQRQHFLPQFLLKGFTSTVNGNQHFVTVFRKDQEPFETNIINVGVEAGFYDGPSGFDLETALSSQESDWATLVENLRHGLMEDSDKELIVDFVCNLVVRTKHCRESLAEVVEGFLSTAINSMTDPGNRSALENYLLEQALKLPEMQSLLGH